MSDLEQEAPAFTRGRFHYGSHVHPFEDHPRDGNVDVAIIPDHIEDHDDLIRLSVIDASGGNACVLLTREQARELGRALIGEEEGR